MKKTDAAILRNSVSRMHNLFRETATSLPDMPDIDITVNENRLLSVICMKTEEKKEGITLKELAATIKKSPATTSEFVERLVQKDLLIRVQNPADRRAVQITPTENTRKLMEESLRSIDDLCEKILAELSPAEQKALLSGLNKLVDSIPEA